jgi:hypothetical protein
MWLVRTWAGGGVLSGPTHIAQAHLAVAVQRIVDTLDNPLCTSYTNSNSATAYANSVIYVYLRLMWTLSWDNILKQCST